MGPGSDSVGKADGPFWARHHAPMTHPRDMCICTTTRSTLELELAWRRSGHSVSMVPTSERFDQGDFLAELLATDAE